MINPYSHPDVMVRSPETYEGAELFWYAWVLGIFHANVWTDHSQVLNSQTIRKMEFLWVQWFGAEPGYKSGSSCSHLPKIGFVESSDDYAFGFLDPAHIIRGCHLIPAFVEGHTSHLLPYPQSHARMLEPDTNDDWTNFYVGM